MKLFFPLKLALMDHMYSQALTKAPALGSTRQGTYQCDQ